MGDDIDLKQAALRIASLVNKSYLLDAEDELIKLAKHYYNEGLNHGWAYEQDKEYAANGAKESD